MNQTVVGIFDNPSDAPNAVQQLLIHGFTRADIDISINKAGQTDERVSNFFTVLFGKGESTPYSEAARRSGAIVTVHAKSEHEAREAAAILDEAGAVDMDERAGAYRASAHERPVAESESGREQIAASEESFTEETEEALKLGTAECAEKTPPVTQAGREKIVAEERPCAESVGEETGIQEKSSTELYAAKTAAPGRSAAGSKTDENAVPIIEEQLKVGKKEVETGKIRLRSKIIERPVEESLRLREEHVYVEKHPVDRPATEAELQSFKEGSIELTEHAEVPVVSKEARVVEEVKIGKEIEEREEVIREKLRKTQVDVESGKRPSNR
ncbi:YsnF/AvaK domain-containing protein [Candidatus Methylomicrobium oryzae]|jgi:uncharacterized protein (TIGR02271 family)|uniref:YsnF/AvaK domain-containing protein n=1 Tax=Candidatus Methylomicrobium oryzae TaxID=2802053 RepID=UPI0019225A80|nr:YsnF/AvaK domain-containing protein [Methylomicrobium sp. RS1]MBL1264057.1 YsnF/AvaK domain-containing protein [Methylomicrobium sp. RS1]